MKLQGKTLGGFRNLIFIGLIIVVFVLAARMRKMPQPEQKYWEGRQNGCIIQEDEQFIYTCSAWQVAKTDKNTGEKVILWENPDSVKSAGKYLYYLGNGLLLGNRIYFVEIWMDDNDKEQRSLSTVLTDGSGYERLYSLDELGEKIHYYGKLQLGDGMLSAYMGYVENGREQRRLFSFWVSADGELTGRVDTKDISEYNDLPYGYTECTYQDNGEHVLSILESRKRFGGYLLYNDRRELVRLLPDGKIIPLCENEEEQKFILQAYNDRYLLLKKYNKEYTEMTLYLEDVQNWDRKELYHGAIMDVITMGDDSIYLVQTTEEGMEYTVLSLSTGELTPFFSLMYEEPESNVCNYLKDAVIQNGFLYFVGERENAYYLMRKEVGNPNTLLIPLAKQ